MKLLDFYATWCEPCKWSEPIVQQVIVGLGGCVVLEKIDIDIQAEKAELFNVRSVPTFILLDGEKEIWRMNGFDTASKMTASILEAIKNQTA